MEARTMSEEPEEIIINQPVSHHFNIPEETARVLKASETAENLRRATGNAYVAAGVEQIDEEICGDEALSRRRRGEERP